MLFSLRKIGPTIGWATQPIMSCATHIFSYIIAVQNERDKITRKPADDVDRVLSPQALVSAEILSRPAQSPSGM